MRQIKDVWAMAMKNTVEVVIAGKVFKISGYESGEYLHQVAVYINEKLAEFQKLEGYKRQNADQKQLMLNMNLADDFFKAKRQADKLSSELEKKEREMYGIRHDLIEAQLAKEKLEQESKESLEKIEKDKEKEVQELKKTLENQKRSAQQKLDDQKKNYEKEVKNLQKEIQELQKQIVRLEAEADQKSQEAPARPQNKNVR